MRIEFQRNNRLRRRILFQNRVTKKQRQRPKLLQFSYSSKAYSE